MKEVKPARDCNHEFIELIKLPDYTLKRARHLYCGQLNRLLRISGTFPIRKKVRLIPSVVVALLGNK